MDEVIKNLADVQPTSPRIQPVILPSDTPEQKPFVAMLNGTATNQLISLNSSTTQPVIDAITGNATIEQGTLRVFIDSYNELTGGLRVSTSKLLDACTIALTEANHYRGADSELKPTVTIPLDRFMELCGVPSTKASKDKMRRKVKEDLDTLYHISMEWTENSGKKQRDFAKMRICEKVGIIRGNITLSFSMDMARYLTNAYLMQYPVEILKLDERNANIYPLGRKLLLHNSIDNNRRKGTANIISVTSLLAVCPTIPTYEQVMSTDRAVDRRIKERLETALNALSFISWEYSNSKGVALTEEQLAATDYKTFSELYILFEVLDAPDHTARLERKAEAIEAKKRKRKASKKKKPEDGENA